MNILIAHGYLLSGTGSNLYVSNLTRELCKAGHNVYLLCQEPKPLVLDYIQDTHRYKKGNFSFIKEHYRQTPFPGKCHFFRPDLEGFLPVYVVDHYEGFKVKAFTDCSDEEIKRYVNLNLAAMEAVLDEFRIDAIQTNHAVMLPCVASRIKNISLYRHFMTVHGSALNFSVKRDKRLVPCAIEGFKSARIVFTDSAHAKEELDKFFSENNTGHLSEKVRIIPAGVDISNFDIAKTAGGDVADNFERKAVNEIEVRKGRSGLETERILSPEALVVPRGIPGLINDIRSSYDYRYIDCDVVRKLKSVSFGKAKVVMFVGKYMWKKGLYLAIMAAPLILKRYPDTKFVFAGFGKFREEAEILYNCVSNGRLDVLEELLGSEYDIFSNEDGGELPLFRANLNKHKELLSKAAAELGPDVKEKVIFTGYIEHKLLKDLLPYADILVSPSVFPEAFGMVAVEALACGVYPVLTYQSAFREITDLMKEYLSGYDFHISELLLNEDTVPALADCVTEYFEFQENLNAEKKLVAFKKDLRRLAVENYSWEGIAGKYLEYFMIKG